MEIVNESSKVIAQAIMLLESSLNVPIAEEKRKCQEAVKLLEELLEKLTTNI